MVGDGWPLEALPHFGYDLQDCHARLAEKTGPLLKVRANEHVTWSGYSGGPDRDLLAGQRAASPGPAASGHGQPAGTAEAVEERAEPAPGDAHRYADHILEQRGLAEVTEIHRVESCVADQLLGNLAGFRVRGEERAWPDRSASILS